MASAQRNEARGGLARSSICGPARYLPACSASCSRTAIIGSTTSTASRYLADVDDDQLELNQLESLSTTSSRKATRAPLASAGKVKTSHTVGTLGDTILEVEPLMHGGTIELKYLEQPARHMQFLDAKIARVIEGMYRKAGWQEAASRGERRLSRPAW